MANVVKSEVQRNIQNGINIPWSAWHAKHEKERVNSIKYCQSDSQRFPVLTVQKNRELIGEGKTRF